MKKSIPIVAAACLILLLVSRCQKSNAGKLAGPPACNFYYWKTSLDFSLKDKALADSLGMKKLYLRYFDVDWSPTLEMPVPLAELEGEDWSESWVWDSDPNQISSYQVVPVVYLTNRVFSHEIETDSLVAKISRKILGTTNSLMWSMDPGWGKDLNNPELTDWEILDSLGDTLRAQFRRRITEIQLDCDWTPSTRDRYFDFLKAMKKANPGVTLSCTVRLHQFRDREQAGIPPVDQATLMCYNVAPPKDLAIKDAIFDPALVEGYLKDDSYPLPLEAALPLFSWGALFHENQFKGLASGLGETAVKNNLLFAPAEEGRFRFTQDTVFAGVYMREGDLVRLDGPSTEELERITTRLSQIKSVKSISFFDWNPDKIHEYHVDKIFKKFAH